MEERGAEGSFNLNKVADKKETQEKERGINSCFVTLQEDEEEALSTPLTKQP
jgi:hypothetical protein